jgi:ribosomal protein L30/L7E
MRLDPKRVHLRTYLKNFRTSKYPKLDAFNKTKFYPNPRTYRGPFEAKRNENFVRPEIHFEEMYNKIRAVQNSQVINASPFHLVWRVLDISRTKWDESVILRKLGLHHEQNYVRTLVPNTPHHNKLLWQVKHLVAMKPLTFPDGIPTEKDMDCVRICESTGVVRISPSFRVPQERIDADKKPFIMEQRNMRHYLRKLIGIFQNQWI